MATGRVVVFASTRNSASAMSSNDRMSAKSTPAMMPGLVRGRTMSQRARPPRRAQGEGRFLEGGINLRQTSEHCADRIRQDEQDVCGHQTNRRLTDVGRNECDQQSNTDHEFPAPPAGARNSSSMSCFPRNSLRLRPRAAAVPSGVAIAVAATASQALVIAPPTKLSSLMA